MSSLALFLLFAFTVVLYQQFKSPAVNSIDVEIEICDASIPQQIHTLFTENASSLIISWITFEQPFNQSILSTVKYGYSENELIYQATATPYEYFEFNPPTRIIHNVRLNGLSINNNHSTLFYRCGNSYGNFTAQTYTFNLRSLSKQQQHQHTNPAIRFASFGDFGIASVNPHISGNDINNALLSRMQSNDIDFVVHFGDLAYDLNTENASYGDKFLRGIEPLASHIPYMTGIGCHERDNRYDYNVSYGQYLNRFSGLHSLAEHSQSASLHYYSWKMRGIHFISIDTDPWIYTTRYANMYQRLLAQYQWLLAELQRVDRAVTPWLIVYGHRSMYCQKRSEDAECNQEAEQLRLGITDPVSGEPKQYALEPLWQRYAVDLYLSGHTHHYERTWPVYDNGSAVQKNYSNAKGTVYVLSGIGGVEGEPDALPDEQHRRDWNSYMDVTYRRMFGIVTVYNATTLQYDAVDAENNIFDTFVLQKKQ